MSDPESEEDVAASDHEERSEQEAEQVEQKEQEQEQEDAQLKEREREREGAEKEKRPAEVSSNQFLIREGYTTEHRVAIMNREVKYLISLGKHEAALPVCTEAIQLNQSPLSYLNRAHLYKTLKHYEEAISDFSTVIEHDTLNTAACLCQRGICYSKLLDYENAIADLTKSYQLDPSFSCAFNRGTIFAESGDHEAAVLDFNKIIEGKKEGELRNRTVYYRAVSFVKLKRYDEAKFDLRSILLKDPNALAPRVLLAKAYKFTGHFEQSEECLNQCITKDCEQAELFIERSYIRCRLGSNHNLREAYKDLHKALAIYIREYEDDKLKEEKKRLADIAAAQAEAAKSRSPSQDNLLTTATNVTSKSNLPELPRGLASGHKRADVSRPRSRHAGARSLTRSAGAKPNPRAAMSKQNQKNAKTIMEAARIKLCADPSPEVPAVVQSDVEYFGSDKIASVYAKLSQLLLLMPVNVFAQVSNLDVALEDAEKAMQICPENSSFAMTYITCLLRVSKYPEASQLLADVLTKDPHHKKALYYKAFCYRAMGDPLNAVDCLTKILSFSSTNSDTQEEDDELLDGESFLLRVLEMRGLLLHEQRAYKFALADFGRAICIDPNRSGNFYFRGNCHCKLGNFELAIEDFCLAENRGFPNLPFLLMCKGVVLRTIGDNESAVEEFDRAIDGIEAARVEGDKSVKLLLCRIYVYKSLSFITIKMYHKALENLLKIREAVEGTLGNRSVPKPHAPRHGSKASPVTVTVKPGDSFDEVIDPSLRWLVSYHIALSYYMLKEHASCMKALKGCLGALRKYVPDNIALGSCIFFYCVSACLVYKSSNPEEELYMKKCVDLLGECLDTDWCRIKDYNMMLCHFALGKCHQRLENHADAIYHFTEAQKVIDDKDEVASFIFFRRAWSHKAMSNYLLAAEDFEIAKMLKVDDPNFAINYRKINDIAYIEVDNEPDTIEEFMPIFPSFEA